jgi:Restriction endonuclease.
MTILAIIGGILLLYYAINYYSIKKKLSKYKNNYNLIKPLYESSQKDLNGIKAKVEQLENCIIEKDNLYCAYENKNIEKIAFMYADMITLQYHLTEKVLREQGVEVCYPVGKGRGKRFANSVVYAPKSADKVKALEEEAKGYLRQYRCMLYKYNALLEAFPEISKYVDNIESLRLLTNFTSLEQQTNYYKLKNTIEIEKRKTKEDRLAIERIVNDAKSGNTLWLSTLIADYYSLTDGSLIKEYKNKKFPISISKTNELYNVINGELRELRIQNKELKYLMEYYQDVYPELEQTTPNDLIEDSIFPISLEPKISEDDYYRLSKEEYAKLEPTEKNQLALDNYWKKRKQKWVIGRDYERFIGYEYEQKGYKVIFFGIEHRKQDLGIDLICENKNEILIIQCKYWKQGYPIRENAINQLYGTGTKYKLDNIKKQIQKTKDTLFPEIDFEKPIKMILITSSELSDTAKEFANSLGVYVIDNKPLSYYPIIKCNVSTDSKRKIYHLPFDQMYDQTLIENRGEFYAMTVKEAEDKGFRKAYKWKRTKP